MKILAVVGARPQFIKASAVSRALRAAARVAPGITELIVHTGQHYDDNMSGTFFRQLGIPEPAHHLGIGGLSHGALTGRMLEQLEAVIEALGPAAVLVYGDTDSTLAGALAAVKLHVPVAHVEAGLRSFNRRMPEEINRVVVDHVSSILFCPTASAVANLADEGVRAGVHIVGDVMYDVALHSRRLAGQHSRVLDKLRISPQGYALATVHREENTDAMERLAGILEGLQRVARRLPVVLPLHPRTRKAVYERGWDHRLDGIQLVDPLPYLDMVALEADAAVIYTDSGGVQKEAFFYRVPCVTLRAETEWVETLETGWNVLADADPQRMEDALDWASTRRSASNAEAGILPRREGNPYGDGHAADKIVQILWSTFGAAPSPAHPIPEDGAS